MKTGVCRIERQRTVKGRTQTTVSYAVTSVAPAVGGAERLLWVLRKHWDIENRVHWVRDVTFDEDRSQVRTGNAPQSLPSATTGMGSKAAVHSLPLRRQGRGLAAFSLGRPTGVSPATGQAVLPAPCWLVCPNLFRCPRAHHACVNR